MPAGSGAVLFIDCAGAVKEWEELPVAALANQRWADLWGPVARRHGVFGAVRHVPAHRRRRSARVTVPAGVERGGATGEARGNGSVTAKKCSGAPGRMAPAGPGAVFGKDLIARGPPSGPISGAGVIRSLIRTSLR